jgi:hypothetical protein
VLPKQFSVLNEVGEVGRDMGLDGREKRQGGVQKNSMIGERGIGRMMVHVEVVYSSSFPPCNAKPASGSEILDTPEGSVASYESTIDCELLEERSVVEERGELYGVRVMV